MIMNEEGREEGNQPGVKGDKNVLSTTHYRILKKTVIGQFSEP